jgi:hypothetical protein
MPQRFAGTVNLPIQIPAWSIVSALICAVFTCGIMFQKMDAVIDTVRDSKEQIALIKEKQIGGLAAIATLQTQAQAHEARLTNLERIAIEAKAAK